LWTGGTYPHCPIDNPPLVGLHFRLTTKAPSVSVKCWRYYYAYRSATVSHIQTRDAKSIVNALRLVSSIVQPGNLLPTTNEAARNRSVRISYSMRIYTSLIWALRSRNMSHWRSRYCIKRRMSVGVCVSLCSVCLSVQKLKTTDRISWIVKLPIVTCSK